MDSLPLRRGRSFRSRVTMVALLFWVATASTFVGSVFGVSAGGFLLFPLRVATVSYTPFFLLHKVRYNSRVTYFVSRVLIFLMLYSFLSLLWSPDPMLGLRTALIMLTGVLLVLMLLRHVRDAAALEKVMLLWSIAVIVTSLLGLYETYSGQYLFEVEVSNPDSMERLMKLIGWTSPRVFSGNWNNFAFTNVISGTVLLGWSLDSTGRSALLAKTAAALAFLLVMLSYSRAAIVGALVGMTFFSYFLFKRLSPKIRSWISVAALVVVTGALFSTLNITSDLVQDFKIGQAMLEKFTSADNSARVGYYSSAVGAFFDSYGFGKGLGASTEVIEGGSYHSFFMEILAELGAGVLAAVIAMFAYMCLLLWKCLRSGVRYYFSGALLGSFLAFPILQVGPSGIWGEGIFWLWLGVVSAYLGIARGAVKGKSRENACMC